MLFPLGLPTTLRRSASDTEEEILSISCNRERMLFAVLTAKNLSIYWSNPQVLLTNYERSEQSFAEQGYNSKLVWKPDSSAIAVSVSIFSLAFGYATFTSCYVLEYFNVALLSMTPFRHPLTICWFIKWSMIFNCLCTTLKIPTPPKPGVGTVWNWLWKTLYLKSSWFQALWSTCPAEAHGKLLWPPYPS